MNLSYEAQRSPAVSAPSTPLTRATMLAHSAQAHNEQRLRPAQVQTAFPSALPPLTMPASAISASSIASSTWQVSPVVSPQTTNITSNSSVQASPEGLIGRDMDSAPPPFELPPSIVSRKTSQTAMSEVFNPNKNQGLIRRMSNKASQWAGGRRRQSSAKPNHRDHSSGPVFVRRRSDSANTAPDAKPSLFSDASDSEDDVGGGEELNLAFNGLHHGFKDLSLASTASSATGNTFSNVTVGPVISPLLKQGSLMTKVSKKKKALKNFVLDHEAAKFSWDKHPAGKSCYLDDIKEIRKGADASNYRAELGVSANDEPRFFTIIYALHDKSKGRSQKSMHIIAQDDHTFELWTSTLDTLIKHRHDFMTSLASFNEKAVQTKWKQEMQKQFANRPHSDDDEELDLAGAERLCQSLHIYCSAIMLRSKFAKADATGTGRLNFAEFMVFVKLMAERADIRALYRELASDVDRGISLEEFLAFLKDVQLENVNANRTHWEMAYHQSIRQSKFREHDQVDGDSPRMKEAALASFLTSVANLPISEMPSHVTMDRPFPEYYISSSHNTYLIGRQVAAHASIEGYKLALSDGCRCVEVDCWDGANGPEVNHGNTLSTAIPFADVITTINKYAFFKTNFPLWISLEVHCSDPQQAQMVQTMKDIFGPRLVTRALNPSATELPSPSQLLGRILIKVKRPGSRTSLPQPKVTPNRSRASSHTSPYLRPLPSDNAYTPPMSLAGSVAADARSTRTVSSGHVRSQAPSDDNMSSGSSDCEGWTGDAKVASNKISQVLGELGIYAAGQKFDSWDSAASKTYNHIFSFTENTFENKRKQADSKKALDRHNMRFLMRVYPNATRIASTNFDPLAFWRRGVQMAALNWQNYDIGTQLNEAMFSSGADQNGYVLKPEGLRQIRRLPNVLESFNASHVKTERQNVSFSIDVLSAQQLTRPQHMSASRTLNPYVEVEVYHADEKDQKIKGVVSEGGANPSGKFEASGLGAPHRRTTQIVTDNGYDPVFDAKFNFNLTTKYPELVFVRFVVRAARDGQSYASSSQPPLATYTAKLSSLKQGYRTLPLKNEHGDQYLFSTLFCRIKVEGAMSILIGASGSSETVGKFKSLGRSVFARAPSSPKMSVDSSRS